MRFIHCEIFQGALAAAQLEYPTRELYGNYDAEPAAGVINPVVLDQLGEVTLLPSVDTVAEAIAAAKSYIEQRNRSYVNSVLEDRMPASSAVQHFEDCGIPIEAVPQLALERPYYPNYPSPFIQYLVPDTVPGVPVAKWLA